MVELVMMLAGAFHVPMPPANCPQCGSKARGYIVGTCAREWGQWHDWHNSPR